MKIKDLAELLDEKLGRNSLPLKKLLCGFSRAEFQLTVFTRSIARQQLSRDTSNSPLTVKRKLI
jgi:hypothetical protein